MVTVCAWCQKYMGSKEPLQETRISHGICGDSAERDSLDDTPVLVVSPGRARAIPVLESLLRGADHGRPVANVVDRRETDRRRAPSLYLV
jgi:hypothetical protein